MKRITTAVLTALLLAGVLAAPASAQSPSATIDIDDCTVKTNYDGLSRPFTWAYCPISTQAPAGQSISFRYRSNLSTYKPVTGLGFRNQSGKLSFGSGQELLNLAFAFRNRTPAQVADRLKVTLSSPVGATLTDSVARANGAS